jgi:hypothetical protein
MPQDWNKRLYDAYDSGRKGRRRPVRLPASGAMSASGEGDNVTISLRADAVVQNMQDNNAAFEGWSLALKRWCKVDSVRLQWEPPADTDVGQIQNRHYERFLYRVARFEGLFPEWFVIEQHDQVSRSRALHASEAYLNVAGNRVMEIAGTNMPVEAVTKRRPEYDLEMKLLTDAGFKRHYEFGSTSVRDRQFPVGLFSTKVPAAASAIFPGGKGAIDLVCLDGKVLWLFELKAGANLSVGTVTELIFYTSVIRDALGGRFRFANGLSQGALVRAENIAEVKDIRGVMLGHNLHPLLADSGVIRMLNEAASRHWNGREGFPNASFGAGEIISSDGDPIEIRDVN